MAIKSLRYLSIFAIICFPALVTAGPGMEQLRNFNRAVQSLQADFTQTLVGDSGEPSSGQVVLQRPGRFRWDYQQPYQQLIVGNGKRVWIYDADLEQVTVRPFDAALGATPALLLSSGEALENSFTIEELPVTSGVVWLELTPIQQGSNFDRLRLAFFQSELLAMELADSFGQITRIEFTNTRRNLDPDPGLFEFSPPAGVDVVGE